MAGPGAASRPLKVAARPKKDRPTPPRPRRPVRPPVRTATAAGPTARRAALRGGAQPRLPVRAWGLRVGVNASVILPVEDKVLPGLALDVAVEWRRLSLRLDLGVHGFALDAGRPVFLVRPTLLLGWRISDAWRLLGRTLRPTLELGATLEHGIRERGQRYDSKLGVGPQMGLRLAWTVRRRWLIRLGLDLRVFVPGTYPAGYGPGSSGIAVQTVFLLGAGYTIW